MDTSTWKKSHFILTDTSDFHMIDNQSIVFRAFARRMLTSFSVDEIMLLRYVNWSINIKGLRLDQDSTCVLNKMMLCLNCIHIEANASCCLLHYAVRILLGLVYLQEALDSLHSLHLS